MIRGNLSDQVLCNPHPANGYRWRSRRNIFRLIGSIVLAVFGFLGMSCILRVLIKDPINLYAEIRSEKLALATQWAPVATVAAFGTSHVDCGFDPRSFDASLASGSLRPVSLNLAVSGGSQIEQTAVAREFQRLVDQSSGHGAPHLLLMEANSGVNFIPKFMTHPRSINIYDGDALSLAFQFSDPKIGRIRALGRSMVAIADYALHFVNLGMLSSQIFRPSLNSALVKTETQADRRGLSPPPPSPNDAKDTREVDTLMGSLSGKSNGTPALITPGLCAEATRLRGTSAAAAMFRVMYIVTPKLTDLKHFETYPDTITCGPSTVPIINVALPESYPELYDPLLWHDVNHLNERGAGVFSTLLGRAVGRALDRISFSSN